MVPLLASWGRDRFCGDPRKVTIVLAWALAACGNSGSGGDANGAQGSFAWDAQADAPGCALHDCFEYVSSLCPQQDPSTCTGNSQDLTSNALVFHACFSDGSKQVITEYASDYDMAIYRPDGAECLDLAIGGPPTGGITFKEPGGRVLASASQASGYTCGGLSAKTIPCEDAGPRLHLEYSLGACQTTMGPCP
jgi:hypothetical protein